MATEEKDEELYIFFPQNIQRLAEEFCKERLKKEKAEQERKLQQEEEDKRVRTLRLENGLTYALRIFCWATAFRNSDLGKELMRKSHIPTAYNIILFYDGHAEGVEWVGLGISEKGLFWERSSRLPTMFHVKSASDLAVAVDTRVLKEACEWIGNGKVWECVERRFDYLKEREKNKE